MKDSLRTIGSNRLVEGEKLSNIPDNFGDLLRTNIATLTPGDNIEISEDKVISVIESEIDFDNLKNKPLINGHELRGDIILEKALVGLDKVDNTSDENKPISIATQFALESKVEKEYGKGLSTCDFTSEEKEKLNSINDDINIKSSSILDIQVVTELPATPIPTRLYLIKE